ncbi:MAG: amidohydrolase [Desulfobacteraceae bacterium]|nr:amidohydrolase [Desulfobacteraceae bacterium]
MVNFKKLVKEHESLIINTRRNLHRIPELSFNEKKTSAYVAEYLEKEGLEVKTGIARTGVVGLMRTGRPGPVLMIRADMDALPITEDTGLDFASTHKGVMHACGHDAHMAMALGAATILGKIKSSLKGDIKFVFQPAEENEGGAKPMIEQGVMENPHVDYAIGCHVSTDKEGCIGVKPGILMAAVSLFHIKIIGRGGHGATPHLCVDSLDVGVQVVNALQRIVSRHIDPLKPAVVTVGSFHAGNAYNIIPDTAELTGTARTLDQDMWDSWKDRIDKIVRNVCESMGAGYELIYKTGYPPTVNDEYMADLVWKCAVRVVGEERVILPEPSMGAEDMSYFLQKSKGCYYFLGTDREGSAPIHSPRFDFNEDILLPGVETHCRVAEELLGL